VFFRDLLVGFGLLGWVQQELLDLAIPVLIRDLIYKSITLVIG